SPQRNTSSAPALRASSAFSSVLTVEMTLPPKCLMICVNSSPTPPAPACTSAVWPGLISCELVARYWAVRPCSGIAAATSADTPSGTRSRLSVFTTTWVAYDPGASCQATRSPMEKLSTPSPTAAMRPVPSEPTICGYSIGYTPERRYVSMKFTPAVSTSTGTSPGPSTGFSTSPNSRTSGPPASIARTAWVMTTPAYNLMCWYSYTYERSYGYRLRCHRIRRGRGPPAAELSPPPERHHGVRTFHCRREARPTSTPSCPIFRLRGPGVHRRGARRPRCRRPRPAARPVRGDLRPTRADEPGHPHRRPRRRPPPHQRSRLGKVLRLRTPRHLGRRPARTAHRRRHEAARSTDRHEAHRRARLQRHRRDAWPRPTHPGGPGRTGRSQRRARQRGLRS